MRNDSSLPTPETSGRSQSTRPRVYDGNHPLRALFANSADLRRLNRELLREMRGQMGELRAQRARLTGIHRLLQSPPRPPSESAGAVRLQERFGLTGRELDVAMLLAEGRSNAAIAMALDISPHTARHHTQRVLGKVGVHSRAEAGARLRG